MKFKIFIFSLFFFTFNSVFSQNLKGIYVLNENTKTPISSVLISNSDNSFQKNSDENGFVNLQNFIQKIKKFMFQELVMKKKNLT
jgi:hypothetical protein